MNASRVRNLAQWFVAPVVTFAITHQLSGRPTARQAVSAPPSSVHEAISTTKSKLSSWKSARLLTSPRRRIQGTWAGL